MRFSTLVSAARNKKNTRQHLGNEASHGQQIASHMSAGPLWSASWEDSPVTVAPTPRNKDYLNRAVEVSIHVGLVFLLATACFVILRPFLPLLAWGIVVAIAAYPGYRKLQGLLGGRGVLAAVVWTLLLLIILIVPVVLLTGTLTKDVQTLAGRLMQGT